MTDNRTPAVFDLGRDGEDRKSSPYPSLRRRPAEDRAREIVEDLKDVILNSGRGEGKTGMRVGDWTKIARRDIASAIRDAEASAAFRELMSASRIGGVCLRVGFLLFAAVSSFAAFWFGVIFIGREYGPLWGFGATMSAIGLTLAFVFAGLTYGGDNKDSAREKAKNRFEPQSSQSQRRNG